VIGRVDPAGGTIDPVMRPEPVDRLMATEADWDAYRTAVVDVVPTDRTPFRIVPAAPGTSGPWPEELIVPVVVVTAWNPDSIRLGPEENSARHRVLVAELAELGVSWWPATGRDVSDGHAEQGAAVIGMSQADGVRIGRAHGQAAVYVWTPVAWEVVSCRDDRRHTSGWLLTGVPHEPGGPPHAERPQTGKPPTAGDR
jgi:Protein of unknown function (DUF3293)